MFFRFPFLFKTISDSISPYDLGFDPFLCLSLGIPISIFLDFPRKTMGTKAAFSGYFLASIFYLDQCEGHTFSKICDLTFFPSAFDHISIFHFWNFFKKKKRYWTIFGDNFFLRQIILQIDAEGTPFEKINFSPFFVICLGQCS